MVLKQLHWTKICNIPVTFSKLLDVDEHFSTVRMTRRTIEGQSRHRE